MKTTLNINGRLINIDKPLVMGILNLTEDSFYDGGKYNNFDTAIQRAEEIIKNGGEIIDIGACSTRPGAELVSPKEEISRIIPVLKEIRKRFPQTIISIDTVWSSVVKEVMDNGADMINDISGGQFDKDLFNSISQTNASYILMHTTAKPNQMQLNTNYEDLYLDISKYFAEKLDNLYDLGVKDVILDLGFGFGKTIEQNYELIRRISEFKVFNLPILTGISRKSMIYKPLNITPNESLNATTALNMIALLNGTNILRVHDVKQAVETIKIYELTMNSNKK
ncbi:MAG: dihydropteroate synthase [Bacteroidales bacterium]|jgi:dihydropteroate synthase|nr:dihydropteroate synthase [Bacteroidales bacterium]